MPDELPLESLLSALSEMGIESAMSAPESQEQVRTLYRELLRGNQKMNLTRITAWEDYLIKHVLDSLLIECVLPALHERDMTIADVGCGAGIPGLPLAIANGRHRFVEIDSAGKKIAFVAAVIDTLGLDNCRAVQRRANEMEFDDEFSASFDLVLVRAVGKVPVMIRECRGLLRRKTGILALYKTPGSIEEERPAAEAAAAAAHMIMRESAQLELPAGAGSRQFLLLTQK